MSLINITTYETRQELQQQGYPETSTIIQCKERIEGSFWRPEKVAWRSARTHIQSLEEHFRKRSDYVRWEETIRAVEERGYTFKKQTITHELFEQFYSFYCERIQEKEEGEIFLPYDWAEQHLQKGDTLLGYFCYHQGKLCGGFLGFFSPQADDIHASFIAVEHTSGITAGLQKLFLEDFILTQRSMITYGKDRNLYGLFASPGLIYHKSTFGLTPSLFPQVPMYSTIFVHIPLEKEVFFFIPNESSVEMLDLVIVSDQITDGGAKYHSSNVKNIIVYSHTEMMSAEQKLLSSFKRYNTSHD